MVEGANERVCARFGPGWKENMKSWRDQEEEEEEDAILRMSEVAS